VDEALRLLLRSLQLKPGNPSVEYHLGIALRESGAVEQARSALQRALEAGDFPEAEDATQALRGLPGA
jgi:Flp pilus assembly protein TadD